MRSGGGAARKDEMGAVDRMLRTYRFGFASWRSRNKAGAEVMGCLRRYVSPGQDEHGSVHENRKRDTGAQLVT